MPSSSPSVEQQYYARKLYALLRDPIGNTSDYEALQQAIPKDLPDLGTWWDDYGHKAADIGSASDRVSLKHRESDESDTSPIEVRHPISGQRQSIESPKICDQRIQKIVDAWNNFPSDISIEDKLKRLFLWCWRFYPEQRDCSETALLNPAHHILPDCSIPSYNSTVSALTGAMFPLEWTKDSGKEKRPYLLLFTFSPVQEFIKASRKFADFWSGSYMLHYLSARLCWKIVEEYGPDAVITPSLWGQEIIDALLVKDYLDFKESFQKQIDSDPAQYTDPVSLFGRRESASLSTAGFPNTITALVPNKENAIALGQTLQTELQKIWCTIAKKVCKHIKNRIIEYLADEGFDKTWKHLKTLFPESEQPNYKKELRKFQQHSCWEWNKLWKAQIEHTWQPYFVAIPLGNPDSNLDLAFDLTNIDVNADLDNPDSSINNWINAQNIIAQPKADTPTKAECQAYQTGSTTSNDQSHQLNVGTWWGSLQARLGQSMQAIKNTRRWQIPIAPGERSSLSGQFSALHPCLHYTGRFKHGRGMASGSIRMFWKLMSWAYPGLFDGSERLNALELTKRMAWIYGGVAEELGIDITTAKARILQQRNYISKQQNTNDLSARNNESEEQNQKFKIEQSIQLRYEFFSRFPNASSIAAGRFIHDHPEITKHYWQILDNLIRENLPGQRRAFRRLTHVRPSNIPKTDRKLNSGQYYSRKNLNGVMFSSKWLAQDLSLNTPSTGPLQASRMSQENGLDKNTTATLRDLVGQAHTALKFNDGSPADWWVLVLADGDGMGQYVNGRKLYPYREYLIEGLVDHDDIDNQSWTNFLNKIQKRMGPATHVGLNRALLDFSNRLVPHLTEHRFCGKVIYSGGDDVLVALPLADLPGFLRSLRAAWCGGIDPEAQFEHRSRHSQQSSDDDAACGYWHPPDPLPKDMEHLPKRPLFTMGAGATMSMGIIVAHKSVPLPTVLENLWEAEKERAKKLVGGQSVGLGPKIPPKDGLCFRVIYGSGNTLEALMKGYLLDPWWEMIHRYHEYDLSPVFNRLAEELPKHVAVTGNDNLCCQAAKAILLRRDNQLPNEVQRAILNWLSQWETWAWAAQQTDAKAFGIQLKDLAALLRFTAFWVSRRRQELDWVGALAKEASHV